MRNFIIVEGVAHEVVEDLGKQAGGNKLKVVMGKDGTTRTAIKKYGFSGWHWYTPEMIPISKAK